MKDWVVDTVRAVRKMGQGTNLGAPTGIEVFYQNAYPIAKPYFECFGLPIHHMTRVSINSPLPKDIEMGFAEIQEWEFVEGAHPVIVAWAGLIPSN